jgi:hypothetical protein
VPLTPGTTRGAIDPAGEADLYRFSLAAEGRVVLDVNAEALGSRLDGLMTLHDAAHRPLASNNGERAGMRDPYLSRILGPGTYYVKVAVLPTGVGGPQYFYDLVLDVPAGPAAGGPQLSPNEGRPTGGAPVTIKGVNLTGATAVRFAQPRPSSRS